MPTSPESETPRAADPRPGRTRAAILTAATEIASSGRTMSMQSVAAEAGVSRSALYTQFAGLDDLAAELLADAFATIGQFDQADRRAGDEDVVSIASRAASRLVGHIHDRWTFYASSLDWSVSSRAHDALVTAFAETVAVSLEVSRPGLTEEQRRDLALFVGGGAMSFIRAWLRSDDPATPEDVAARLIAVMPQDVVRTNGPQTGSRKLREPHERNIP